MSLKLHRVTSALKVLGIVVPLALIGVGVIPNTVLPAQATEVSSADPPVMNPFPQLVSNVIVSQGVGLPGTTSTATTNWYVTVQGDNGTASLDPFYTGPVSTTHYQGATKTNTNTINSINAIGFSENDHYVYGMGVTAAGTATNQLIKVGVANPNATSLTDKTDPGYAGDIVTYVIGTVTNANDGTNLPLPGGAGSLQTWNAGTMGTPDTDPTDPQCGDASNQWDCGNVLFIDSSETDSSDPTYNKIYEVNVLTGKFIAVTLSQTVTKPYNTLDNSADMFFYDGYLWAANSGDKCIYRIDVAPDGSTGDVIKVALPSSIINLVHDDSFGAQWVYGNGNIGLLSNGTNYAPYMFQIQIINATSTDPAALPYVVVVGQPLKVTARSSYNDGTSYSAVVDLGISKIMTIASPTADGTDPATSYADTSDSYTQYNSNTTRTHGIDGQYPRYTTATIPVGSYVTYRIQVHNYSPATDSSGYTITDFIPKNLLYPSFSVPGFVPDPANPDATPCSIVPTVAPDPVDTYDQKLVCTFGTLVAGADGPVVELTGQVDPATTEIVNKASVQGFDKDPSDNATDPNTWWNNTSQVDAKAAALSIVKAQDVGNSVTSTPAALTDSIAYTFTVKNISPTVVTNVSVVDYLDPPSTGSAPTVTCPPDAWPDPANPGVLETGESVTCTASAPVTQADIDAGSVNDHAVVSGLDNQGKDVSTTSNLLKVPLDQNAKLGLTKTVTSPSSVTEAGQMVTYQFTASNAGTVTLHDVTVTDPGPKIGAVAGTGQMSAVTCPADGYSWPDATKPGVLPVGKSVVCSATYTVGQGDIDAGDPLTNTATVTGDDPAGDPVDQVTADATVGVDQNAKLGLTKTVTSPSSVTEAGQVVTYQFTASNAGTVTLKNVTVTDPGPKIGAVAGTGQMSAVTCPADAWPDATKPGVLPVGKSVVCSATYTVSQGDIDAGGALANTATVAGDDPAGNPVDPVTADASVDMTQAPGLALQKMASVSSPVSVANTPVTYTFKVRNTGNVTLTNVTVSDPLPAGWAGTMVSSDPAAPSGPVSCVGSLPVGDEWVDCTGTFTYTVSQADIDAGTVLTNEATAAGEDPASNPVSSSKANATVNVTPAPGLGLTKQASVSRVSVAGDQVDYTFTASNTGNVTLTNVTVTDPGPKVGTVAGTGQMSAVTCPADGHAWPTATPGVLPVGKSVVCSATYTVSQGDINAGGTLTNTATATGYDLAGVKQTWTDTAPVQVVKPSITLTKTVSGPSPAKAGDELIFHFTAVNGPVALQNVTITDDSSSFTGTGQPPTVDSTTCKVGNQGVNNDLGFTLGAGQTVVCDSTPYTVTQDDVNSGVNLRNYATVTGSVIDNARNTTPLVPVSADGNVTAPLSHATGIQVVKSVDLATAKIGDALTYTLTVTNTGDVTLTNWTFADTTTGTGTWTPQLVSCRTPTTFAAPVTADTVFELAPKATIICQLSPYTVTAADATAGKVTNAVVVTGTPALPGAAPVLSKQATVTTQIPVVPVIWDTGGTAAPAQGSSSALALLFLAGAAVAVGLLVERRRRRS